MTGLGLIVPGDPVPWARPGRRRDGGSYTHKRHADAVQAIRAAWSDKVNGQGVELRGPLHVQLSFCLRRPASHYGTGRNSHIVKASAPIYPTGKPDVDNLAKLVLDALEGHAWHNDSQITTVLATKVYDTPPRTVILARPLVSLEG